MCANNRGGKKVRCHLSGGEPQSQEMPGGLAVLE